jgi:hypothetical protein
MIPANNWPDYLRTQHDVKQLAAERARSQVNVDGSLTAMFNGPYMTLMSEAGEFIMDTEMTEAFLGEAN